MPTTLILHPEVYWVFGIAVAALSLCVGSFLNVVIHRMPLMMQQEWTQECSLYLHPEAPPPEQPLLTLSHPASRCPHCGHHIRWYENIPLLSWIALRGKCSACKTPIGIRYPLVELGTALASLAVFFLYGPSLQTAAGVVLTWCLVALTGIDFDTQLLPDRITLPLAGLGLAVNSFSIFCSPSDAIWGYVLGFLSLWSVYFIFKVITGKHGMGHGDFKLLAALGAWLGVTSLSSIIFIAALAGSIVGLVLFRIHKESKPFAFGPYLAIAGWVVLLGGGIVINRWLGMS